MTENHFLSAVGRGEDWAHVAQDCADNLGSGYGRSDLGFLYVTDLLAEDLTDFLGYLRRRTGIRKWVGSVGMGIHANGIEIFDEPAAVAMVCDLPPDTHHLFTSLSHKEDKLPQLIQSWAADNGSAFGLIHADPTNDETAEIVRSLGRDLNAFLVGGLTSSRGAHYAISGAITGGGVSGVLFGPQVPVATGLSQGCAPLGKTRVISDCLENIIIGIDGRPALDVLNEDAGCLGLNTLDQTIHDVKLALPIEGSDTGDYLVRSLQAIDSHHGWLGISSSVASGERVMFVHRDPETARRGLERSLEALRSRVTERPRGAVYHSCVGRGPQMFGPEEPETAFIRRYLGDIPLVGFFASAEISNARLYEYTGVLTLFL